jgi:hypothetical protein
VRSPRRRLHVRLGSHGPTSLSRSERALAAALGAHAVPLVAEIPVGFEPLFRTSPFLDMLGPFFYRRTEHGFVIGLQVADKHANARGSAHGGLLLTLADNAKHVVVGKMTLPARHVVRPTAPFNVTGSPALSLTFGWSNEGLPIGIQLVGRHGDEATLLRLGMALERFHDRRPLP